MLQKNQILTLEVTDLNNFGYGVAHHEGMTVFLSDAVDGDVVDAVVILVKKTYAVARPLSYRTRSPHRTDAFCGARACGGCAYGAISYRHETEIKYANVTAAFRRAGLPDVVIDDVVPAPSVSRYRNKAQYPVAGGGDQPLTVGFFAPRTHRVVPVRDCPLQPPVFSEILATLCAFFDARHVRAYEERTHTGLLRHIYLRRAERDGSVLLTIVINASALPDEAELVAVLTARHPELVGILVNTNTEDTNVICGAEWRTLWGADCLTDTLAGVTLHIAPPAFYQVNHAMAEELYRRARTLAALTGREQVLDLFCGTGSIGLSMAGDAREVIGVEIVPEAVENARENARLNGIANARFFCGDATDVRRLLQPVERETALAPDVVILDPPRRGCDAPLLDGIAAMAPARIVYISCNPETLARDVARLIPLGYTPAAVTPLDLFPRTGHVECVTLLTRTVAPPAVTS